MFGSTPRLQSSLYKQSAPLFNATAYSGCAVWLKASDLLPTVTTGTLYATNWADRISGSLLTGSVAGDGFGKAPQIVTGMNGFTALRFVRNYLASSIFPPTGSANRTFVVVVSHLSARVGYGGVFSYGTASANQQFFYGNLSGTDRLTLNTSGVDFSPATPNSSADSLDVLGLTLNAGTLFHYTNGAQSSSFSPSSINTGTAVGLGFGANVGTTDSQGSFMLYEFAAYNTVLTPTQMSEISATLRAQYRA